MIDKLLRKNSPIVRRPLFIRSSRYDPQLLSKITILHKKYTDLKLVNKFEDLLERYERMLQPRSFLDRICYSFDGRKKKLKTIDHYFMEVAYH